MQAGLRLVQHEQAGRPRAQQRRDPQQVAQACRLTARPPPAGAAGRAGAAERTAARPRRRRSSACCRGTRRSMAASSAAASPISLIVCSAAARSARRGSARGCGCRPGCPGRRAGVGAEMVVEPPGPDPVAQAQQLGHALRVGELAQHAVVLADPERGDHAPPSSLTRTNPPSRSQSTADGRSTGPAQTALPLDHRVQGECASRLLRQAEVDGVAEVVRRRSRASARLDWPPRAVPCTG